MFYDGIRRKLRTVLYCSDHWPSRNRSDRVARKPNGWLRTAYRDPGVEAAFDECIITNALKCRHLVAAAHEANGLL